MQGFLVDASLPRATNDLVRSLGHDAIDVRDVGLGTSSDALVAAHAIEHGLCILTRDQGFGDPRVYPPEKYHGIVVLSLSDRAHRGLVLKTLEDFLGQLNGIGNLTGRLAIVEPSRIRLRPR